MCSVYMGFVRLSISNAFMAVVKLFCLLPSICLILVSIVYEENLFFIMLGLGRSAELVGSAVRSVELLT